MSVSCRVTPGWTNGEALRVGHGICNRKNLVFIRMLFFLFELFSEFEPFFDFKQLSDFHPFFLNYVVNFSNFDPFSDFGPFFQFWTHIPIVMKK